MYKLLLCWRYLLTRYLAFVCIISVMLGVATLIVVNSVMSGFSTKLRTRLQGMLSDIVIESQGLEGFTDPQKKMAAIRQNPLLNSRIKAMAETMEVFAMMQFRYPHTGEVWTRPVRLIGVDPETRAEVGGFREHLVHNKNPQHNPFELPDNIKQMYEHRERLALDRMQRVEMPAVPNDEIPPPAPPPSPVKIPQGVVVGNLIAGFQGKDGKHNYIMLPGDSLILTTLGGEKLQPVYDRFVVVDYFKSEMSESDNQYIFVDLKFLQHLRTMEDRVTHLQIKLHDYKDAPVVVAELKNLFDGDRLMVHTWEAKQGPLLAAIDIEKGILNVLLFLIIAVAGFGILAIFSMIVAEKTRDIGILKALGASNGGVMQIFLSYGLLLGVVGASCGTLLGLTLTWNINEVEHFLSKITGNKVFNGEIYYFHEIPTDIQASTVILVNIGAIAIAVLFSILPAMRAALLHPVRALRYE